MRFQLIKFALLLWFSAGQSMAGSVFVENLQDQITKVNWDEAIAGELAEAQELSFMLHEANGTIEQRISGLARFNNNYEMQELVVRHPGYLDFFLNLRNPSKFIDAMYSFSRNQERQETLLEVVLLNPSKRGQRNFEHVVIEYGEVLGAFADFPEFGTLLEILTDVARQGGTTDFEEWLYELLENTESLDIEWLTTMLAKHGDVLRYQIKLSDKWEILTEAVDLNIGLQDILLEHLDIWNNLSDNDLIEVLRSQLNQFGKDKAFDVMIFFLGYDRSLVEVSVPEEWRMPLRSEYYNWALDRLIHDPSSPVIEAAFHFRNDHDFWQFAMRPGIEERLPCLLAYQRYDVTRIKRFFNHNAKQVDDECLGGDWVPGGSLFRVGRKLIHGTPIEQDEIIWASLDVADAALTIATLGAGKLAVPVFKGGILASKSISSTKMVSNSSRAIKLSGAQVTDSVKKRNFVRNSFASVRPGLMRVLGTTPSDLILNTTARHMKIPSKTTQILREIAMQTGYALGGLALENSLTTEFIRCAGIDNLKVDDPICLALFPPANEIEFEEMKSDN